MKLALAVSPLDYQSIFEVSGIESESFLQGQLTCNLKEVIQGGSRLAAHCTPKGSMLSLMRVIFRDTESFFIKTNNSIYNEAIKNLNKYIIFSKAGITNLSEQWTGFGLYGTESSNYIKNEFNQTLLEINDTYITDNTIVIKIAHNRFEIWFKNDDAKQWLENDNIKDSLVTSDSWRKLEIMDGIPDIYPQTSSHYIPQMCNLQALQGVSFQKGCYTGQEVITRLHFRGKLTKYLVTASIQKCSTINLNFNSDIYCEQTKVGKLLQWVTFEDKIFMQIIVNQKYAKEQLLVENLAIDIQKQPYELDPNLFIRND